MKVFYLEAQSREGRVIQPFGEQMGIIPEGDLLGTVGVFLSGMGTLLTAFGAFHFERKRGRQECEEKFAKFYEGLELSEKRSES
jgi:hypothetical protein